MNIEDLAQHPDSGQQSGSREQKMISRVLQVPNGTDWAELVPAEMEVSPWGDGYFKNFSFNPRPGYGLLVLNYLSSPTDMNFQAENDILYDLNVNDVEKDLRDHPSFKMKWFYDLHKLVSTLDESAGSTPSFWDTATSKSKSDLGDSYIWAESEPSNPSGKYWKIVEYKTKPGKTSYVVAQPVITAQKFCRSRATAEAFLLSAVGLAAPGKTFNWSSTATKWLATPRGIHYDGTRHIAINEYAYADNWDTDIYTTL